MPRSHCIRLTRRKMLASGTSFVLSVVLADGLEALASQTWEYPVTIEHRHGRTTIVEVPKRIVTLGWGGEDAVLALGRLPVGMPEYSSFSNGVFPWNEPLLQGVMPTFLGGETDYEAIAALRPDIILCVRSGVDRVRFERLSNIAPTIPFKSAPWTAGWEEVTEMTGLALGLGRRAKELISETQGLLLRVGAQYPVLAGKTVAFGSYATGGESVSIYMPTDTRVATLTRLGLDLAPVVKRLAATAPDSWAKGISLERPEDIDADILVMWLAPQARAAAEQNLLFNRIPAVRRGSCVVLDYPGEAWGVTAPSVLSIPYVFPAFVKRLAEAAMTAGMD